MTCQESKCLADIKHIEKIYVQNRYFLYTLCRSKSTLRYKNNSIFV